jgi:cytochrome P450
METFILRMAMDPAIQKRAQAEIDSVTKGTRLPEIEDKEHLPYMEACVKEALRFHPPTPLGMFSVTYLGKLLTLTVVGIAHRLMQDDIYKGYHIPKGSIVMANIW